MIGKTYHGICLPGHISGQEFFWDMFGLHNQAKHILGYIIWICVIGIYYLAAIPARTQPQNKILKPARPQPQNKILKPLHHCCFMRRKHKGQRLHYCLDKKAKNTFTTKRE